VKTCVYIYLVYIHSGGGGGKKKKIRGEKKKKNDNYYLEFKTKTNTRLNSTTIYLGK